MMKRTEIKKTNGWQRLVIVALLCFWPAVVILAVERCSGRCGSSKNLTGELYRSQEITKLLVSSRQYAAASNNSITNVFFSTPASGTPTGLDLSQCNSR
jgi:hypothetical protein